MATWRLPHTDTSDSDMLVVLPQTLTGSRCTKIVFVFQISYSPEIMGGTTKQTERILRQPVEKNETQALKQQVHAWTNNMRQLPAKVNVSCFRDSKM